ncbi:MAG: YdcF family protein [Thermoleophilia bacterium]|nr:YdcF family protein [Thermoleophilia bacterium]
MSDATTSPPSNTSLTSRVASRAGLVVRIFRRRGVFGMSTVALALLVGVATTHIAANNHSSTSVKQAGGSGDRAGLVLGAGLRLDGTPSLLLAQRLDAARRLYKAHRVSVLILSGDNRRAGYDQPMSMYRYLTERGVPTSALVPDYAGRRTYDSCWRARHVFGLDRVTVITSQYHAPRTIFTCRTLGLATDALAAPEAHIALRHRSVWYVREWVASTKSIIDLEMKAPTVADGDAIDPFDPCSVYRSMSVEDRPATPPKKCANSV